MAILGLRGTGDWAANERPESWREAILYLFPNGDAPFVGFTSKMASEPVADFKFHYFEKEIPGLTAIVSSYDGDAAIGTITWDSAGGAFLMPEGTILLNLTTDEHLYVTSDPTVDTKTTVERNLGGISAPAAPAALDVLLIVGVAYQHGSSLPSGVGTNPTERDNNCQIVRTPLAMTRTAMKTHLRTGDAWRNAQIEALQMHSIRKEMHAFFGVKSAKQYKGQIRPTSEGIKPALPAANVKTIGNFTESDWDERMRESGVAGSINKAAFCGTKALKSLNAMAKRMGVTMIEVGAGAYGHRFVQFAGSMVILYLSVHPLFSHVSQLDDDMFVVDLSKFVVRYIDDTVYVTFRQSRGDDFRADEFLSEDGYEIHHRKVHFYWKDFGSFIGG